jgi:hypothetical protein
MSQPHDTLCPVCRWPEGYHRGNHIRCTPLILRAKVDNREVWSDAPATD